MINRRKFLPVYTVLFLGLVVIDVFSKMVVEDNLSDTHLVRLMPSLNLVLIYNRGAAFGFLSDGQRWQLLFFVFTALIVSLFIIVRLCRTAGSARWNEIALVLILAGAVGNMLDRVRMGYVVDFIQLYYRSWYFPAFNMADMAIFFGVVMLMLEVLGISVRKKRSGS